MANPDRPHPIGVVRGGRTRIFEDHWGGAVSRLVLEPAVVDPSASDGLSGFSHIEVVFHFHRETRVRRGAMRPAWQPGVAAGRRARWALAGPPEPPWRLGLRTTRGSRPRAHRSGARRHRRNADPGHQAIRGRVPAGRLGAVTCLDARADGPLLLTPGRAPRMRPERAKGARRHPRERLSRTRTPLRSTSSLPIMSEWPAEIFRGMTATEWPVIALFLCGLPPRSLTVLGELMISRVVAVACRGVQRRGLAAADPGARSAGSGLSAVGGGDDPAGRDEFEQVGDVARVAAGELGDLSQPVAY